MNPDMRAGSHESEKRCSSYASSLLALLRAKAGAYSAKCKSNWKQVSLGLLALCFAAAAALFRWPVNDPLYQGRRLSEWVVSEGLKPHGLRSGGIEPPGLHILPSDSQELEAILEVGPNALPLLVRMLGSKESSVGRWSQALADKYSFLRRFIPPRTNIKFARIQGAVVAFYVLGPRAEPAVPEIIPLLTDPDVALAAMLALMYIRPAQQRDILSLTNVLSIGKPSNGGGSPHGFHSTAMIVLSTFGAKASAAVPFLLQQVTSTNEVVRGAAALALARIGAPPEKAVPLILQSLPKTNPPPLGGFRPGMTLAQRQQLAQREESDHGICMSTRALGEYGPHARMALPVLSNLLSYPLGPCNVQKEAKLAIARIAGDTNYVTDHTFQKR